MLNYPEMPQVKEFFSVYTPQAVCLKYLFVIGGLALVAYLNTLGHGFVLADQIFIVKSDFIQDWRNLFRLFSNDYLRHTWENLDVNRPVMVLSLILDFSIWELNPFGYHLTNLLLHLSCTITLLYTLVLIFDGGKIPIIAASIFAVHPIHIQAVNAINAREDLLVTLFYLLSLFFFIKNSHVNRGASRLFLSCFFYLLALLSKEMALTLPIICILYLRLKKYKIHWLVFAGYFIVTSVYLLFYLYIKQFSDIEATAEWGLPERIYGAFIIYGRYLWLHLFPIELTAYYDERSFVGFSLRKGFLITISLLLIAWSMRRLMDGVDIKSFFAAFFFISLLPVMNIIPIMQPIAERFLYLPSFGLVTFVAIYVNSLLEKKERNAFIIIFIFLGFFLVLTIKGNMVWKNEYSIFSDTIKKSPKSEMGRYRMGQFYAQKRKFVEAHEEYQLALKYSLNRPFFKSSVHNSLGLLFMTEGQHEKAYEEFQAALKLFDRYEVHKNLGLLYMKIFEYDKALKEFQDAINLGPIWDKDYIHYNLALIYVKKKQHDMAYSEFQKAININPKNAKVYFGLGELLLEDSNIDAAIAMMRKGLAFSPNDGWARSFLGDLYMMHGNTELARKEYEEATKLGQGMFRGE